MHLVIVYSALRRPTGLKPAPSSLQSQFNVPSLIGYWAGVFDLVHNHSRIHIDDIKKLTQRLGSFRTFDGRTLQAAIAAVEKGL